MLKNLGAFEKLSLFVVVVVPALLSAFWFEPVVEEKTLSMPSVDRVSVGMTPNDVESVRGRPDFKHGPFWFYRDGIACDYVGLEDGVVTEVEGNRLYDGLTLIGEIGDSKKALLRHLAGYNIRSSSGNELEVVDNGRRITVYLSENNAAVSFKLQVSNVR